MEDLWRSDTLQADCRKFYCYNKQVRRWGIHTVDTVVTKCMKEYWTACQDWVRLKVARNRRRGLSVYLLATSTFDPVAINHYRQYEGHRNCHRWLQVICCANGNQRVG